jgi:glycosyltransferase involved in cell wall biosynthesis
MRVLFVMQLYPPVHGASTAGENIKNSKLINDSFECDYIRISTIPVKGGGLLVKLFNLFVLYFKVIYKLTTTKYDLVYLSPNAAGYKIYKDMGLCFLSKMFCNKVIYHFHNKGISVNRFVPARLMRMFFKDVKVILSSTMLNYDLMDYVASESIHYCAYGIPDDVIQPLTRESDTCNIIFFANMIRTKGVFDLLEACKILNDVGIDFICNFVGNWYDVSEEEFREYVSENALGSKVNYLGAQYGTMKDIILSKSDIFAFPTYYPDECFPLGILEALRHRLPVVSTPEGAISEIVDHQVNGYLVVRHDNVDLAQKIHSLIIDSDLRRRMGNAGRAKYEREYTIDRFENKLLDIFKTVLSE